METSLVVGLALIYTAAIAYFVLDFINRIDNKYTARPTKIGLLIHLRSCGLIYPGVWCYCAFVAHLIVHPFFKGSC